MSDTTDSANRRAYERFDLLAQVRIRHGTVDYVLEVINVSRGGALIDLGTEKRPAWLVVGREVELRVLDAEGSPVIDERAKVVRIDESVESRTFAVQMLEPIDDATFRRVLKAAGKPPPLPARSPS